MTQFNFSSKNEASASSDQQRKASAESRAAMGGFSAHKAAEAVESTQFRQYNKSTGHGYTAEDVNALHDYLLGNDVKKTGWDNSLNGPDRIVNGVKIQVKYCQTARKSVNAFFDGANGQCKYPDQVLEVPMDQYDEALRIMQEKIRNGQVPGVDNPADAAKLVRQGSVTYDQAVKIAKAGNWESLKFDVKNQAVVTSVAGGISFVIAFLMAKKNGLPNTQAVKFAGKEAAKMGAATMATGVAAQQLLRTGIGRSALALTERGVKRGMDAAMKTTVGKKLIEKTGTAVAKRVVAGQAAKQVVTRAASSNVITTAVAGVVTSVPDTYRVLRGKISGKEYGIRMAERGAGIGGGTAGTWAGMAIGSFICPGVGTAIGGFVGGMLGGIGGSKAASKCLR
jgi:hypothetical protein